MHKDSLYFLRFTTNDGKQVNINESYTSMACWFSLFNTHDFISGLNDFSEYVKPV
jgi:hypothetical protein